MNIRKGNEVLFAPDWRDGNPYMERLASALQLNGYKIWFDHFPAGCFKLTKLANKFRSVGIIHLHWIPDLIKEFFWSNNPLKFNIRLLLLLADILLCRARGIRIIWTLHNLVEHESPAPNQELRVRAFLFRFAHAVIAHSEQALKKAAAVYRVNLLRNGHVIAHGNYLGQYTSIKSIGDFLQSKYSLKGNEIVVLFFGAIRRYKGLDLLLPAFRAVPESRLRLIIAGNPFGDEIRRWILEEAVNDDRVRLSLGFVPDSHVAALFSIARAVVLPFQATLTSGSVILAMGFGKCLILPESARVLGLPEEAGALYYRDGDEADLRRLLAALPELDLVKMGEKNYQLASQLDWHKVAAATAQVYSDPKTRVIWAPHRPDLFARSRALDHSNSRHSAQ